MKTRLASIGVSIGLALIAISLFSLGASPTAQAGSLLGSAPAALPGRALNAAPGLAPSSAPTFTVYLPLVQKNFSPVADIVLIPAGSFQMGCDPNHNQGNLCDGDNPLHTVHLDTYQIDKNLVTNAQYAQCVTAGGCTVPSDTSSSTHISYYGNATYSNYPVIWMTWNQASAFCSWTGKRLPTEAEWEKAARGSSDTRPYPWGDTAPNCTLANFKNSTGDCVGDTTAVGSYPSGASPYGVLDMAGNVWEWVNDWYSSTYYNSSPLNNPPGPTTGTLKVLRGGGWYNATAQYLRMAFRDYIGYGPTELNYVGFRCAATP